MSGENYERGSHVEPTGKNCVESWAFGGKDKICEPRLRTENAGIRK